MKHRAFVIVESPYGGPEMSRNLIYLRRALRDSWNKNEHPLASHGYYPFFLDETNEVERKAGIEAGYQMWPLAGRVIFYADYGLSKGMNAALDRAVHHRVEIEHRTIGANP